MRHDAHKGKMDISQVELSVLAYSDMDTDAIVEQKRLILKKWIRAGKNQVWMHFEGVEEESNLK